MRIGIFGGSFNPIHSGHVELIKGVISEISLDKVLVMPTFIPPHKNVDCAVSVQDRLNMCRIATEDIKKAEVCDLEIKRGGTSYTYKTLEQLSAMYPDSELFLIMGADMFLSVDTWKNPDIIFKLATICGVARKGVGSREALLRKEPILNALGAKTKVMKLALREISSTTIRTAIKKGQPVGEYLPKRVEEYILENHLYTEQ